MIWDASGVKRYDKAKEDLDDAKWFLGSVKDRLVEEEAYLNRSRVPLFAVPSVFLVLSVGAWFYLTTIVKEGQIPGYGNWVLASMMLPALIIIFAFVAILHNSARRRATRKDADKTRLDIEQAKMDVTAARHRIVEVEEQNDRQYEERKANGEIREVEVPPTVRERLREVAIIAENATEEEWEAMRARGERRIKAERNLNTSVKIGER